MKSCLTWFRVAVGTSPQPITGIVDEDGHQFIPEIVHCLHGSNVFNTLFSNGSGGGNTFAMDTNLVRLSDGAAGYYASAELPQFGGKIGSGAGGSGSTAGFASLEASAFFGGDIYRWGTFQNPALGSVELKLAKNDNYFPTDVLCLCLAGVSIESLPNALANGARTSALARTAALYAAFGGVSAAGSIATAAGGGNLGFGWAAQDSGSDNRSGHMYAVSQAGNVRTLGAVAAQLGKSTANYADGFPVATWTGDSAWTTAGQTGLVGSSALAWGGGTIRGASGGFLQPLAPGQQTIITGVKGRWIKVLSVGAADMAAQTGLNDWAELCVGWSDCRNQGSFWVGESRVGNVLPLLGASYSSNSSLLRFAGAGPNGAATAFTAQANFIEADPTGSFTIEWTQVDGVERRIIWMVLGEEADTPPPPIPTSNPMCVVPLPAPVLVR